MAEAIREVEMKLWILRPKEGLKGVDDKWRGVCDTAYGFVVRAESERQAREFAAADRGDEGESAWLNPLYSDCKPLSARGVPGVIIRDYTAG